MLVLYITGLTRTKTVHSANQHTLWHPVDPCRTARCRRPADAPGSDQL